MDKVPAPGEPQRKRSAWQRLMDAQRRSQERGQRMHEDAKQKYDAARHEQREKGQEIREELGNVRQEWRDNQQAANEQLREGLGQVRSDWQEGKAQQPPPKGGKGKKIAIGLGVALLAVIIIGSIADGDDTDTTGTANRADAPAAPVANDPADDPAPEPEPEPEPDPVPVQEFSGTGDDVVDVGQFTDLGVMIFECASCSSNTVVESDGPEIGLVNEIGPYSGKRWINLSNNSMTTQFIITADSDWTLTLGGLDLATQAPEGTVSGTGDDVILLGGDATAHTITHSGGMSNFIVDG
jgi:hypothetical protein